MPIGKSIAYRGKRQVDEPDELEDFLDTYEDEDPWPEDRDSRSFYERRLELIGEIATRLQEKNYFSH